MKIVSITPLLESVERHDLEILGTHNFVASGVVVHNCNGSYLFSEGQMHCRSRTEWKKEFPTYSHVTKEMLLGRGLTEERAEEILNNLRNKPVKKNLWWVVKDKYPEITTFCEAHPGLVLCGEVYGQVQDLKYGSKPGEVFFAAFDVWDSSEGKFWDWERVEPLLRTYMVPVVPEIYRGVYSEEAVRLATDGTSLLPGANHVREGCVVKPLRERRDDKLGRVILKSVSNEYLSRAK